MKYTTRYKAGVIFLEACFIILMIAAYHTQQRQINAARDAKATEIYMSR